MPTTYGSPVYADHQPNEDAWVVSRLNDLSATILGKTVTTEFAWREPGPTRNPWNLKHTPGGSSGGSASAVAGAARTDEEAWPVAFEVSVPKHDAYTAVTETSDVRPTPEAVAALESGKVDATPLSGAIGW